MSYVYGAELTVYDIKTVDIILGKGWMCDIVHSYQINHDCNEMWIADKSWRSERKREYTTCLVDAPWTLTKE